MNKAFLIGRLTKDPELKYSQAGTAISSFTLAIDRQFKNAQGEKETDFINIVAFKAVAELCANYLSKGKMTAVDGRIQTRNYEDKDGRKVYVTEVIAENVQFLTPKERTGNTSFDNVAQEVSLDDDFPF